MKQFYTLCKQFILVSLTLALTAQAFAQSETTVYPASDCNVVENFNSNSGSFTSPSIYSDTYNTQFNWDKNAGAWIENSGLQNREASMLSGVYQFSQLSGSVTVGFAYNVPANSEYRIRVIRALCSCEGGATITATTANGPVWTPLQGTSGKVCINLVDQDIFMGYNYLYEITIRATQPGSITVDDFSLGERSASPLPVTFKAVLGKKELAHINVLWDVADEVDVKGYEVERSSNGVDFANIGFVSAQQKTTYNFIDAATLAGNVYYRVKSVDIDGKYKYSSVIRMSSKATASNSLKVSPLPATTAVTVQHSKITAQAKLVVRSANGSVVKLIQPVIGTYQTAVDIASLKPGIYIVSLEGSNGNMETTKMVKL